MLFVDVSILQYARTYNCVSQYEFMPTCISYCRHGQHKIVLSCLVLSVSAVWNRHKRLRVWAGGLYPFA